MKKRLISAALLSAMLLGMFTGCTNSGDSSSSDSSADGSASSSSSSSVTTMRVTWWGNQTRNNMTQEVLDLYASKNPGIKFESDFSDFNAYWDKLATQVASNSAPDLIQHDYRYIAQYADKKAIADLSGYVDDGTINLDDCDPQYVDSGRVNGKLYGINLGNNIACMQYFPDVASEAGVTVKDGMKWSEFMDAAKIVYDKSKIQTSLYSEIVRDLEYGSRSWGLQMYSADQKSLGFGEDLVVEVLQRKLDAIEAGICPTPENYSERKGIEQDMMLDTPKPTSWVGWYWSNQISALTNSVGKELEVVIQPISDKSTTMPFYFKPSMFFTIAEQSKMKDEVAKFIDFFTNDVEANKILQAERGVPISSKIREALLPELSDAQKKAFDVIERGAAFTSPLAAPDPIKAGEVNRLGQEVQDLVLYKEMSVQQGAAKFVKEANAILASD